MIISAKNEAERLEACFASLSAQKSRFSFEVHLVDNASSDGTYAKARKLIRGRKNFYVWKERKPGSPAARNLGARKARGEILLFTDADCRCDARWLEEMTKPLLEERPYPLAALGGRTESAYQKADAPNLWERYLDELFQFWETDRTSAFPAFLPWAPTCNLAVRRDVFEAIGGFDERWRSAAYDVDLCWRIVLSGFVFGFAPKALVKHLRRHTLRGLLRQIENYAYYNHSLLVTYEKLLGLSALEARKERLLSKARHTLSLVQATRSAEQLSFRAIDTLAQLSVLKGALEARIAPAKPNPKLHPTRKGQTPKVLLRKLPRGYQHLHKEGWSYWKDPASLDEEGDLILFHPKRKEWFRLNETAWKVWEVKSEGGQSEDAASALGFENDPEVLHDIDEVTLDLRTRRLLP